MRVMYDDILASGVPDGADLYAGYDDGQWPDAAALAVRFPGRRVVRITVFPSDNEGDVLDVETGDAAPGDAPGWLQRRRAAGATPSLYVNRSNWGACITAINSAGLAQPPYWLATMDGESSIPAAWVALGVVALQVENNPNWDRSIVLDYWPGIDPPKGVPMPDTPELKILEWAAELWDRLPTDKELSYSVAYYNANGDAATYRAMYVHDDAVALRAKRGW